MKVAKVKILYFHLIQKIFLALLGINHRTTLAVNCEHGCYFSAASIVKSFVAVVASLRGTKNFLKVYEER